MATDQIELFLRNALRQKAVEDRLIRQAVKELRSSLLTIQRLIGSSSALLGPNREASIRSLVAAIARNVQQSWGIPQLRRLQEELTPFLESQLEFARQMVQAAGGSLTAPGAASINAAAVINNAVVGGRTLGATLTQQLPALIADRVERYLRLGLLQAAGEVLEVRGFAEGYRDAVVTITTRNVEAVIRSGVHDASSAAQMAIYEVEADPDWLQGSLLWTAVLDSDVCPVCLAMDGTTLKLGEPGRYWDGRNKISPHLQCRCFAIPADWRTKDMLTPSGDAIPAQRPAEGDSGEQTVSFKRSVRDWLQDNPETTRRIFGKRLGNRLLDPRDRLDLPGAVKIWQAPAS